MVSMDGTEPVAVATLEGAGDSLLHAASTNVAAQAVDKSEYRVMGWSVVPR